VELIPSKSADHVVVAQSILSWMSRYGMPRIHISDQGSHFKNLVIAELSRLTGFKQRFTIPYTPYSNGTVERVNREILRAFRSLLSEFKMQLKDWPDLIPLIQMLLNHSPLKSLGGLAPVKVFCGLNPENPVKLIVYDSGVDKLRSTRKSPADILQHVTNFLTCLGEMHRDVASSLEKRRESSRSYMNRKLNPEKVNWDVGDFVLVVRKVFPDKLISRYFGPEMITRVIGTNIFEVQNILTGKRDVVHASRLQFYKEQLRDKEFVKDLVGSQTTYVVENLLESKDDKILVKWKGFEDPTWESIDSIREDVPKMLEDFLLKGRVR
jgi:hypothetical protein